MVLPAASGSFTERTRASRMCGSSGALAVYTIWLVRLVMDVPSSSFLGSARFSVTFSTFQFGLTVGVASVSSSGRLMAILVVPDVPQPWGTLNVNRA
ncbi:hypothetical protein PJL18_04412 [Paenarthrobacter nicotinovorans]|nr:hypothetical protein [Paenarthrobacter nicotinovorans]